MGRKLWYLTNEKKHSRIPNAGIANLDKVNWELVFESINDLYKSTALSTVVNCEEQLLKMVADPDEIVRLELENNIGAVNDLFQQLKLLGMPAGFRERLERNGYLLWTASDVAAHLSAKARHRWLWMRFILHNDKEKIFDIQDFEDLLFVVM